MPVERALEMIPEMFRAQLNNMTIAVEDLPSRDLLREMDMPSGETLFGVFTGVPLPSARSPNRHSTPMSS